MKVRQIKLNVDKKNNCVIAIGYRNGRKIRAIAHCQEPEFDEEFGKEVAIKKYNIKYEQVRKKEHERTIKSLHRMVLWCYAVIEKELQIANRIQSKIDKQVNEYDNFISEYFKGDK